MNDREPAAHAAFGCIIHAMLSLESAGGLELLRIQHEASLDRRGRWIGYHGLVIASCLDGQELWIGDEVPDAVATELAEAFERASPRNRPGEPPQALEPCARILESGKGALQRRAGPSYLIPHDLQYPCGVAIEPSDGSDVDRLRGANPGNWDPIEWDELLGGQLGPWTIIVNDDRAVSICHTPGPLTERAGECGVWTDSRVRGRGYAAATVAAWIALVRSPRRHLFYSTDQDNQSSQRVARRLGLAEIGWIWRLHRPRSQEGTQWHPLSSLRVRPNR